MVLLFSPYLHPVLCVEQIPLVLSFFSTEDRIHALKSEELQQVLNSVMFEPARFLHADVTGKGEDTHSVHIV